MNKFLKSFAFAAVVAVGAFASNANAAANLELGDDGLGSYTTTIPTLVGFKTAIDSWFASYGQVDGYNNIVQQFKNVADAVGSSVSAPSDSVPSSIYNLTSSLSNQWSGAVTFNSAAHTVTVTASVPGPVAGAGVSTVLVALGMMYVLRRRVAAA